MTIPETTFDFSQFAAGLADAATLLAEAARQMSEAARAMGHGLEPDTHTPHVPLIIGIPAPRDDSEGEETDLSAGQSDSEDESLDGDVRQPGPHVGTSTTSGLHISPHVERDRNENNSSLSQAPMITGSDEVHSGILSPGRYYIVLEEEFDVLPLIAIYASVCRKMLCCMPFIESSQSWRTLLSAISPNHEVLEVTSQSSGWSPSTAQYISSVKPTLLIQSFEFWQTYQTISSISDSFLVWGFLNIGEEQLRRIKDAILSTRHTCAILTSQEYGRTNFKTYLNSLGFMEHPKSTSFNKFFATSLLARFRTIVQGVLRDHKFFSNIESLYKAFIGFYLYPPSDDIMWSKTRVAQLANSFAAKILLHGREEDGSSRFKPDGLVLPVDNESSDKFGPKRTFQLGLVQDTTNYSNLPPSIPYSSPTAPSRYETRRSEIILFWNELLIISVAVTPL
ncbi:hypothetical protein B0J17DRAFT_232169 [Rhizoctonia solani]|nr:hypothetical protein B0J17DRAFT_232169 [Rhizoctonia solani]